MENYLTVNQNSALEIGRESLFRDSLWVYDNFKYIYKLHSSVTSFKPYNEPRRVSWVPKIYDCFMFRFFALTFIFLFFIWVPIFPLATSSMAPMYIRHGLRRHQSSRMLFRFTLGFILVLDVQQLRTLIYNILWDIS